MSFSQVADILSGVARAHKTIHDYCRQHEFDFGDHQRNLFLSVLQHDQDQIRKVIRSYEHNRKYRASQSTWIQFVPEQELAASVRKVTQRDHPEFDELVEAVAGFYEEVGGFVQRIRDQSTG